MRRIAIGLLIAPLWAPALMAVYAALLASPPDLLKDLDRGSWIGLAVILDTLLGYAAVLAIGLPAHLVLQRRNRRSVWAYLITWFAGAVAAWSIVFILSFARYGLGFSFSYLAETIVHRPYVPLAIGLLGALMAPASGPSPGLTASLCAASSLCEGAMPPPTSRSSHATLGRQVFS